MNFGAIKWQEDTVSNLKLNISQKKFSHAILFCGEKTSCINLAHACADALLCESESGDACGICPACVKTKAGSHPDKFIIMPEKNKSSIGVDPVREAISEMYIRPYNKSKKVFIIEEGSQITKPAQNALLKILENPPDYGVIIIVAQKEEDLLPTVLSRLKKYTLRVPSALEIADFLAEKYPEKRALASFCGKFCEGKPYEAEELIKKDGDFDFRKRLLIFFSKLATTDKSIVFDFANYLSDKKDDFLVFISYMQIILRDLMFITKGFDDSFIINSDMIDALKTLAKYVTADKIAEITRLLIKAKENISKNASFVLTVNNFLLNTREVLHDRNSWN